MRVYYVKKDGRKFTAVWDEKREVLIDVRKLGYDAAGMLRFIRLVHCDFAKLNKRLEEARSRGESDGTLEEAQILAPIEHPHRDVICMGLNYQAHAEEMAKANKNAKEAIRYYPIYFGKPVDRIRGHMEEIPSHSDFISTLDYECELGVIMGKDADHLKEEDVRDHIFGYTIINDVTGRELSRHKQNYYMKGLDGTCPMGPCIVTAEEIAYPPHLNITLDVNGEPRQNGYTSDMIFGIDEIVSVLSQGMVLQAGTIFATGSPTGIGYGMNPPVFLKDGDVVHCHIDQIGDLTNIVKDGVK